MCDSSPTSCSISVDISAHANIPPRRKLLGESRNCSLSHYRSGSTGSEIFWGVPQPVESLDGSSRRTSPMSVCDHAYLLLDEFSPLVGVFAVYSLRVALHQPDLPSSQPHDLYVLSLKVVCPRLVRKSFSYLPPPHLIPPFVGRRTEPTTRPPPDLSCPLTLRRTSCAMLSSYRRGYVSNFLGLGLHLLSLGLGSPMISQPTMLWGFLVSLINCLRIFNEFTGVGAKAGSHITMYLSYAKSLLFTPLPVGLAESFLPPLASFSLERRTARSVSLPNIKWKCTSISITVLPSCVPVRLGPEDATDVVSTILRSVDWVLTSYFYVTISQLFDFVVKALSTHSSFVLFSLSSSYEVLSYLSPCVIVALCFKSKRMDIPSFYCNR